MHRRRAGPRRPVRAGLREDRPLLLTCRSCRTSESGPTDQRRVAIVTGAARGIGAATARRLAEDGLAVAVVDPAEDDARGTVQQVEATGGAGFVSGQVVHVAVGPRA